MQNSLGLLTEQAMEALNAANWMLAESISRTLLKSQPKNAAANLIQAICLMETGKPKLSIPFLKNALKYSPNDYVAMIRLPIALRAADRYDEALTSAENAFKLWPDDAEVLSNLALCLLAKREVQSAVGRFKQAIMLQPGTPALHHNLGTALELLGEDVLAAHQYRIAIDLAPHLEESYGTLVLLLLTHGNAVQALEVCRKGVHLSPNSPNFRLLYSRVLREVLEKEEAEIQLKTALNLDPGKAAAGGFWMQEEGRFEEATAYFNQALEKNPDDPFALLGLIQGKEVTQEDGSLLRRLEGLIEMGLFKPPTQVSMRYALGKGYNDLQRFKEAMEQFDEANRLNFHINVAARGFDPEKNEAHFDRFIETFSKDFFTKHKHLGSESELPIFIVGMIRSGTTLTEQIMSSHPKVAAAGEQKFWMAESPRVIDVERGTLDEQLLPELAATYIEVLKQYAPQMPHLTDKMPLNYFWVGLIHLAFPNARIIHVRRSPIDTCLSIYMTALAKAPDFAYNRRNIIAGYREYERIMSHWRKILPANRLLEIDYEVLVCEPEPVIRKMIDFSGLEWDDACLHHELNPRSVNTPSVWQVRQPMYRTSVNRWRNYEPWLREFSELLPQSSAY